MFSEQDQLEIVVEGLQNGDVFINDEGIAVDAWNDPIFKEDEE